METARGATKKPDPSNSVSSVIAEQAGLTRSRKKRLLPKDEVVAVESLAADIQTACLLDKDQVEAGDVISADNLDSLVPDQAEAGRQGTAASSAGTSASKEQTGLTTDTQEEAGGGQSRHQNSEVVHSVSDSET